MENGYDHTVSASTSKQVATNSATTFFVFGSPTKPSSSKQPRSFISRDTLSHLTSSLHPRPTKNSRLNNRPIVYGTARPKSKPDNKPVAQSIPLAFPATTNFVFNAPSLDTKFAIHRKSTNRAIQILPTDVLIIVIRSIKPNRHHQILKVLSLVSRVLNATIAPILYHNIRLFNLKEVYEFALHFRYPTSITSLEMFITPDPQDLEWSPPDTNWTERLVERLRQMERLMTLTIKRCRDSAVLNSLVRQANNPSFLPALERLSFGYWHQLMCLASGRTLTSYGLAFDIQDPSDYENLDKTLAALRLSNKSILELKLTVALTDRLEAHIVCSSDRQRIIHSIVRNFPELHTLILRIRSRKSPITPKHVSQIHLFFWIRKHLDYPLRQKVVDILTLIPQKMVHLNHLELFDMRSPEYRTEAILTVAEKLSAADGLCPKLDSLSLDGLTWKRVSGSPTSQKIPLDFSHLTLSERGGNSNSGDFSLKVESNISLPEVAWTPCPNNPRGLAWWAKKAPRLNVSSRIQIIHLLREWMLRYWDPISVPADDSVLDRAVPRC